MRSEESDHTDDSPRDGARFWYAGLVSRLTALVADVLILTLACLVISVMPSLAWTQVVGRSPGWLGVSSAIVASLLPWAYFTVAWWITGQTLGGLLVGTTVTRGDGRRALLIQAALRAAIGLALAPLWLVGLLGVLWSRDRRAWHDVVFRTVVRRTIRVQQMAVAHTTPTRSTIELPAAGGSAGLDE